MHQTAEGDVSGGTYGSGNSRGQSGTVQLSGTVVKRASLHNADIIESLDLHLGDMVYVEKGGEIIPKITGVDKEARPKEARR